MATVDVLITELKLKTDSFTKGMQGVFKTLKQTGFAFNAMFSKLTMAVGIFQQIAFTVGLLGGALAAAALNVYDVYVTISSLQIALQNTIKDGTLVADVFQTLVDISNRTGAGIDSLARSFTGLNTIIRNSLSTTTFLDIISSAVATIGGTSQELDRLLVNFRQVLSMGRLTGDEFREIAAILPQFSEALINAFGTVDTEKLSAMGLNAKDVIKGAVDELAKMPVVLDSPRLGIERLSNAFMMFKFRIGEVLQQSLGPFINVLSKFLNYVSKPEIFNRIFRNFRKAFTFDRKSMVTFFATLLAYIESMPAYFNSLKETFNKWFNFLRDLGVWLVRIYAVILGVQLVRAIWPVVTAVAAIGIAMWNAVTGAISLKAVASGFTSIIPDLIMLAAVIAGVVALEQGIKNGHLMPKMPGMPEGINMQGAIDANRRRLEVEFGGLGNSGVADPNNFNLDNAIGTSKDTDLLETISDNTFKTSKILEQSLQRHIVGGGGLAAKGVSPQEIDKIKHGVKGDLDRAITNFVEDIIEETLYKHLQRARVVV